MGSPALQDMVPRLVVRPGAVLAGGHDGGKGQGLAPPFPQAPFDLPGHLALRLPRGELPGDLAQHRLAQFQGPAHGGQFLRGLHLPQLFHHPFQGPPLHLDPFGADGFSQALIPPKGNVGRFEPQPPHPKFLEQPGQGFPQAHLINHYLKGRGLLPGPKLVAKIGEQHRGGRGDKQGAPIGIIGGEAAEIAAARRAGDQQSINFPPAAKISQGGQTRNFEGG